MNVALPSRDQAVIEAVNDGLILDFMVDEIVRDARKYLDGFLEDETLSSANAEHIAIGIISVQRSMAIMADGGGAAIEQVMKQLVDAYGPKARAKANVNRHLTDQQILASIVEDHHEGKHTEPFLYCNQCREDHP